MADPIPFYAAPIPTGGEMPPGAIPVRVYGLDGVPPIDESQDVAIPSAYFGGAEWVTAMGPMRALLSGMDYGEPGQVLATNSTGDELEWVDMPTAPTAPTEPQ